MLGLSRRTEVNKRINKTVIYEKFQLDPKQKEAFDADVSFIYIANEISEYSVGVAPGEDTFSIHVLRIIMKSKNYNDSSIIRLFKLIGNKVILALEHGDEVQIAAYHTKLFKTKWQPIDEATISLNGLNLDSIYVNLITQIGGFEIEESHILDEQIASDEQKAKLEKEIARLERMARNEKQPKKKFELVQEIKRLKARSNNE